MPSINRIKTIFGWVWIFLLSLSYSMPLVLFATWKTFGWSSWTREHPISFLQMGWGFAALVMVFIGVLLNKWIRYKKWDSRGMLRMSLLVLLTFFFILFIRDDKAIVNDYSWDDVPNPPKAEESYALLYNTFNPDRKKPFEIDSSIDMKAVLKDPLRHKTEIEQWWQETTEMRKAIAKLDTYDTIGDLTSAESFKTIRFVDVLTLSRVIFAYGTLKAAEGHVEEGLPYLFQCHSVTRKALPSSRYLINKMIWLVNAARNIDAAYNTASRPSISKKALQLLKTRFAPLTAQEIAIKRTFISEYLFSKNMGQRTISRDKYLSDIFAFWCTGNPNPPELTAWEKMISKLFFYMTYKPNQTIKEIKTYYDFIIEIWDKHPMALDELKAFETNKIGRLKLNNIGYWVMTSQSLAYASMSNYIKRFSEIKVRSDLLGFYLDHKLDNKSDLKDFYTGIEYRLDKDYGARSAGPDGQFNTEDDITLDVPSPGDTCK